MNWIKGLIAKLVGKHFKDAADSAVVKVGLSKEKLIAILAVVLPAIEPLSTALGHPIHIPAQVYTALAGAGYWSYRDRVNEATKAEISPTPTPLP